MLRYLPQRLPPVLNLLAAKAQVWRLSEGEEWYPARRKQGGAFYLGFGAGAER